MKKFTLFTVALMAVMSVTAQDQRSAKGRQNQVQAPGRHQLVKQASILKNGTNNVTAIFTEDFGNGIPGTWSLVDNNGSGEMWAHAFGPQGPSFGPGDTLMSPTASNVFAMLDDDFYGQLSPATDAALITPVIDCSLNSSVHISFYDYFLQFTAAVADLSVSNDGGINWTSIYNVTTSIANPNPVDIDVTTLAAGFADVRFKFNYQGDWDYWWQVDDISVYEPGNFDGSVVSVASNASSCVLGAAEPVSVAIRNAGALTIGFFPVSFSVNGGSPVTENFNDTIASGDTAIFLFNATANLLTPGPYTIDAWVTVPSDANSTNDSSSFSMTHLAPSVVNIGNSMLMGFEDTEDLAGWSTDDANADGQSWAVVNFTTHTGTNCIRTTTAGITMDDWLFTSCIDLLSGTNYSLDYWLHLFSDAGTVETYIGSTNSVAGMTQFISSTTGVVNTWIQSTGTFTVAAAGTYYVGFRGFELSLVPGNIRIDDVDLSIVTSVNDAKGDAKWFDLYPNPASDNINININIPFNQASVEVINTLGAVVLSFNAEMSTKSIDISNLESGIYTAKLKIDGKEVNKRFTISK